MPRWLLIAIAILSVLFGWQILFPPLPAATPSPLAIGSAGETDPCPLPDKYRQADQPLQSDIDGRIKTRQLGNSTFTPLAGFSLQARVLARENYTFGSEAEFSPTDLALGWGPMAETGMARKLNIKQSGRFYYYSWGSEGPPIEQGDIARSSANMHIVPANRMVSDKLKTIAANDVIELHGWLIRIDRNDGWRWQSSLTRDDTGAGACELVYVCRIVRLR